MFYYTLDIIYKKIIRELLEQKPILNERTKVETKSLWGVNFDWDMSFYPLLDCRQMFPKTGAAELAWMLRGTKNISFIRKYSKIWDKFTDDDKPNEIKTAYGYRWSHAFGYDQINNIIEKLKKDPSSRQQILLNWDPRTDNIEKAKNIPCPFAIVVGIIDGRLNLHLTVRSQDWMIGFPYDILTYTLLGNALANSLNIPVGKLHYSIANCHIYENHFKQAKKIIESKKLGLHKIYIINNNFTIEDIREMSHDYVDIIDKDCLESGYNMEKERMEFDIVQ